LRDYFLYFRFNKFSSSIGFVDGGSLRVFHVNKDLLRLIFNVFGKEHGIGVRSAVGMILPDGIPVEVEAMFELH
jgi:hypothetical protein